MSAVTLLFPGDHPLIITGQHLSGYHRPLSGEAASLTMTVDHAELWPEWLENPPLGAPCLARYCEYVVLDGVLTGLRVNPKGVELKVAG